jgi:hypothetical protein
MGRGGDRKVYCFEDSQVAPTRPSDKGRLKKKNGREKSRPIGCGILVTCSRKNKFESFR